METYLTMIGFIALFLVISAAIGIRDSRQREARQRKMLRVRINQNR